jgi:hypothetical protein
MFEKMLGKTEGQRDRWDKDNDARLKQVSECIDSEKKKEGSGVSETESLKCG